jgi:YbbR domain-containing protein
MTETFEMEVALNLPEGVTAPFAEETINVKLHIEPLMVGSLEFTSDEIAIENMDPEMNYEVLSPASNVFVAYVRDAKSVVEGLNKDNFKLSVDAAGVEAGDHRLALKYFSEGSHDSVEISPETLLVRVTRR